VNRAVVRSISHIHIAAIIILGFTIYANSLNGKFVWDDYGLIKENAHIKDWRYLPKIIKEDFGSTGETKSNFYRPLQMIAHMIDYSLCGFNVQGYHLTSILLHILTALSLYFFVRLILYDVNISFLASLLFLAHPINTEAVSYISGLSDPLSLLFILLCLVSYIKYLHAHNIILYILALLSFSLALLSKENAVIVPALVLLYHYTFRKSFEINKIILFFVVLLSYTLLRLTILTPFARSMISFADLLQRIPGFFASITEYLRLLLLPFDLHIEYGHKLFNINDPRVITGLLLSCLLVIIAFLKKKDNPLIFFSIAWFFICLLPVSNIYPINYSFMMEHWLYVPALGFFLIVSKAVCYPFKNKNLLFFFKGFTIVLLIFYSYLTIRQNEYWRDPVAFYLKTLQYTPDSWRFYNELGLEYANAGRNKEAVGAYSKALEIKPDLPGVYYNLMNLYRKTGEDDQALKMYYKAKTIEVTGRYLDLLKPGNPQ